MAPDVFKQLGPLLKMYQEEVDAVTTRAKLGEGAFLEVFKQLYEAPDPAPAISHGLELASKTAELEAQAAKTSQELAEFKAESKGLKNQDLTIRRLEERVRSLEADVSEKEGEVEAARMAAAAELEARSADEARTREERLQAELQRAEAALEAMRRMHQATQAQLFSVTEKGEEAAVAARAEAELAAEEVDRAQERLALLANERDVLLEKMGEESSEVEEIEDDGEDDDGGDEDNEDGVKKKKQTRRVVSRKTSRSLSSSTAQNFAAESAAVTALREELRVQRDLASRLQTELNSVMLSAENDRAAVTGKMAGLKASLQATEAHAAALEAELAGRPTLQELEEARQQIRVLNAVVHNTVGEDYSDTGGGSPGSAGGGGGGDGSRSVGSLESALLAKNRHLEHKLTMARLDVAEAQGAAATAAGKLSEIEAELEQQRSLVAQLEDDLIAAGQASSVMETAMSSTTVSGAGGGGGTGAAAAAGAGENGQGVNNSNDDGGGGGTSFDNGTAPTGGLGRSTSSSLGDTAPPTGGGGGGEQTMVMVLSSQRDRLRARVHELESAAALTSQTLSKAKQDAAAARADNVALVEQLRYVQGYAAAGGKQKTANGGGGGGRRGALPSDIEAGSGAGVVGKYMKEYEDRVNPLTDFRSRELEARRRALPIQDRAAMVLGSTLVSGSRVAKSAIVIYALALHLVAFLVLAGFSQRQSDKMDALEEMCAQFGVGGAGGVGGALVDGTDPVVGGAVATVVGLRSRLFS